MTDVVVIGASAGGLEALHAVLGALPADLAAPVVVVQHRHPSSDGLLAELLDRRTALAVAEAEDKQALRAGCALVAPAGYHLLVEAGHVALSTDDVVRYSRPAIDVTFESAAGTYGAGVLGVVLTGANEDGADGLAAIRRAGGATVVQDPASARRAEMPRAAASATGGASVVLPLEAIGPHLAEAVGRR